MQRLKENLAEIIKIIGCGKKQDPVSGARV